MRQDEHRVRVEPMGRTLLAQSAQPVLEAALQAGLNLPHSCKSGHCGSCRARLVNGAIHYPHGRPLGLSAAEEASGFVLLCQARADTDLVVEARQIANVADVEIKTLPCRIAHLQPLAPDVMQVFLRLPSVESLRFQPGQYLDVLLEEGGRRSFSIAAAILRAFFGSSRMASPLTQRNRPFTFDATVRNSSGVIGVSPARLK